MLRLGLNPKYNYNLIEHQLYFVSSKKYNIEVLYFKFFYDNIFLKVYRNLNKWKNIVNGGTNEMKIITH